MRKIPTWAIILVTTLLLYGGLTALDPIVPDMTAAEAAHSKGLDRATVIQFLAIGIPIVILEAFAWTIAPIELCAKFAKSPPVGAALGILGFVAAHWGGGLEAYVASGWIVLVLNVSYLVLRPRSRRVAIFSTVGQKIAFVLYAAISLYPSGG